MTARILHKRNWATRPHVFLTLVFLILVLVFVTPLSFGQNQRGHIRENQAAQTVDNLALQINDPVRAKQNWMLNCQGCHKEGATGKGDEVPNMNGEVAKFLTVAGGKEYLYQVNGIANSPLSNADLAELMNWMLLQYDPEHIPKTFTGFQADEVAQLRQSPLDHTILKQRKLLMATIKSAKPVKSAKQTSQ